MPAMKYACFAFLILLSACASTAPPAPALQDPPAPPRPLSAELLREYLTHLASDELEGRCAGFPGNDKATEFIAARFKESGLKPVGDDGTYYQHFKIRRGELTTRNCAGLLVGSERPDEVVVLGAHHDHVGRKGQHRAGQLGESTREDEIWNGADDNGSGTTALLGVVRHFAATGARPKRSILFLTFSAEEWGLLGSRHYVDHPLLPLDKTVAMLNMDMVGRTNVENAANAYGLGTASNGLFRDIIKRAGEGAGLALNFDDSFGDGSDHVSFFAKGIPILGLSERGPCPDYHKVSDHAEKIDYGTMERIARAAAAALLEIAGLPERPARNPNFHRPKAPEPVSPRLGAYLEAVEGEALEKLKLGAGRGALFVNGMVENSVAETHGMKEGDTLVSIAGEFFAIDNPRESLIKALSRVVRGEPVRVEIFRGGERSAISLIWPATEDDTKVRGLIERLTEEGDPAIEKEIAEFGEAAEARAKRLTGAVGRRVRTGIVIKRRADSLPEVWGTRRYRLRDSKGAEIGGLRLTVSRLKTEKGEPIRIECEQQLKGHSMGQEAICARDSRLSLMKFSRTADGETRDKTFDPGVPTPNRSAHIVLMLIAGTLPEEYHGVAVHGEEGRPDDPSSLVIDGPGSFEQDGKKIQATRVIKKDTEGGTMNVWVDAAGVVLMMEGPAGRVELLSDK
jgi:hypothetical protein